MTAPIEHHAWQQRAGKNQALVRDVNQSVKEINQATEDWLTLSEWLWECGYDTCTERVELTPEEYESVCENPTRFVVSASEEHVTPDVERVVEKHARYWVVEKLGEAAAS